MPMESLRMKMGDWFRTILTCCEREDEEEQRPALQISGPTNFRREDINIPGLSPEEQRSIREKAIADAAKMYPHLQPLRSSPSGQFASPTSPNTTLPSYEDFTTPRNATSPNTRLDRRISGGGTWSDRVRAHSRKISNSLTKPLGYHGLHSAGFGEAMGLDGKYEMRALVDVDHSATFDVPAGKWSGEDFSMEGSDGDSGAKV